MLPIINNNIKNAKPKNKIINTELHYVLNFDGCSKGNPGLAGAGAVICHFGHEIWSGDFFVGEKATNNHAEYAGLILGLHQAIALNIRDIKVLGDSQLVINHMKGTYQCRSVNLIELYEKAKELEKFFDTIEYCHVLRNQNKRADELSNIAINKYIDEQSF